MDSIIYDFFRILSNHYACICYMWHLNCQSVHYNHTHVAFELSICALSLVSTCSCACCSICVSQNSNEEVDLPKIKHAATGDDDVVSSPCIAHRDINLCWSVYRYMEEHLAASFTSRILQQASEVDVEEN